MEFSKIWSSNILWDLIFIINNTGFASYANGNTWNMQWEMILKMRYKKFVREREKTKRIGKNSTIFGFWWKKVVVECLFSFTIHYRQLTWMCHNRTNNSKINRLHERCLPLIYFDKKYHFEELMEKDNFVSIHYKNLRVLAVEMYNTFMGSSKVLMCEIFPLSQETHCRISKKCKLGYWKY